MTMKSGTTWTVPDKTRVDYVEIATQYASDVILGKIPAARPLILACQRFIDDLKRTDRGEWEYHLDPYLAWRVCHFVQMFPHVKGAKGRIKLIPWQVFALVNIYGWVDEMGLRRIRTAYLEVTKKQGKSTFVSPLGLYGLAMDGEEGAEVYCAAVNRDQARIVWSMAKQMANRTPKFKQRYGIECLANAITQAETASTFQALSKEAKTLEGKNPSTTIIDELHRHKTREVWDIIDQSREARAQSLMIAITNSGSDKSSICYEQRQYVMRVLEGKHQDESYFGMIFTIDDGDEKNWEDENVWRKAQPSLGHSVRIEGLRRLARKAKILPSARSSFMRYQLGVWTEGEFAWIPGIEWDACANHSLSVLNVDGTRSPSPSLRGKKCVVAFDLASKKDVAAMVGVFKEGGKYKMIGRFYVPEARVSDNDQYKGWQEQGWLVMTPGQTIDYDYIEKDLAEWNELFDIEHAPYDPFQATQFATRMSQQGIPMVEMGQSASKLSEGMKECERLAIERELEHDGNPMMSWMVANVIVKQDNRDNWFPTKENKEEKIDGSVGLIMGVSMWITAPPPKPPSKYAIGGSLVTVDMRESDEGE